MLDFASREDWHKHEGLLFADAESTRNALVQTVQRDAGLTVLERSTEDRSRTPNVVNIDGG
jgi:hypothetical protein